MYFFAYNSSVEVELTEKRKALCSCGKCSDINISDQNSYLCCNQLFNWKYVMNSDECQKEISCVTDTQAYKSSVNPFSVQGMSQSQETIV